jgi:hypothetical protein
VDGEDDEEDARDEAAQPLAVAVGGAAGHHRRRAAAAGVWSAPSGFVWGWTRRRSRRDRGKWNCPEPEEPLVSRSDGWLARLVGLWRTAVLSP